VRGRGTYVMRRLKAILRQRCPRCLRGRVFSGAVTMNETCPVCGHRFTREPGYFLGAMYVSYPLGAMVLGLFTWLLDALFFSGRSLYVSILVALVPFLLFVPVIFRYSRVIWMHFDTPTS
jgi:uncharacterized protein (DUF983 family)